MRKIMIYKAAVAAGVLSVVVALGAIACNAVILEWAAERSHRAFIERRALAEATRETGWPIEKMTVMDSHRVDGGSVWTVFIAFNVRIPGAHCTIHIVDNGTILSFAGGL